MNDCGTSDYKLPPWRELTPEDASLTEDDPACQHLMIVPGVSPIISSALDREITSRRYVSQRFRLL